MKFARNWLAKTKIKLMLVHLIIKGGGYILFTLKSRC